MKKLSLLFLIFTCVFTFALPSAQAEKYDWSDKDYNFKGISTALVYDLDASQSELSSDLVERTLNDEYMKAAARPGYMLFTKDAARHRISQNSGQDIDQLEKAEPEKAAALLKQELPKTVRIYIRTQLMAYEVNYVHVESQVTWESRNEEETYRDSDGHTYTANHWVQYPVVHPAHDEPAARVRLKFTAFDSQTGKEIFSREEQRVRSDSDDPKGVFRRICESYFNDLKRKINN